jgi:hydrogenase maturation protease
MNETRPGRSRDPNRREDPAPSIPPIPAPGHRLLLGLGNDILGDDAIGLLVVREIRREFGRSPPCEIRECSEGGIALLDEMTGFTEVILVDAVQSGRVPAGHLHEFTSDALPRIAFASAHGLGIPETLALGRALGLPMPDLVRIFAIEVEDPHSVSIRVSPAIARAFPAIVRRILKAISPPPRPSGTAANLRPDPAAGETSSRPLPPPAPCPPP